ncbi:MULTISPECIES: alanine dehydrogenase [Flavobacteriaceae]|jgi:alanine dehydrogenase|uniref:alanine dehydrogenase n=1 Tax=Flagellimonas sp. MMG031 TaxID=3158549 RepID=A0AAU7MXK7_9FLAO|nr:MULTISPECIES: alanine dehydrogenase [Allomuricauda]MBO6532909.1 alanine dehydrogenase [Allomuricauda sp.]MBO6590151.1 alanine dehydrogenase [Allomuricauda sp.]MBO6619701.1 alanine dehydrogenase [Allomuricauda sp.]MBO6645672.1 alanine dehydrogenase [Allomuricauda sp.]MBO6748039.1 alanine dehydrogenase [Allomuricauda sp.]
MSQASSPFSKQQLLPQEETLEVIKQKGELFIGIPKENQYQEKRVCLTPDAVNAITANGHRVLLESGAGEGANFSDIDYTNAGAEITRDTKKVFSCPLILKVEPPTLSEIDMLNPQTIVISALQIKTQNKEYFEVMAKRRLTAIAFEYIRDDDGNYPAVRSLSEIAGISSILIASELMSNPSTGNGLMFGNISGVPPVEVVIIGAGTVGEYAARSALGLGANVKVFDNSISKLRKLQTNLNRTLYTSTVQPKNLLKSLKRCDVAIGATRGKDRSPIVVSKSMVENMKKGSVIIDVSIDMGGCFETSEITTHRKPTFEKYGVVHYGVPNIPSRYPRTSSISISNIFTPYLLKIGEEGGLEHSLRFDKGLRNGLYMYHGILTNKSVGDWFGLNYNDINFLIF